MILVIRHHTQEAELQLQTYKQIVIQQHLIHQPTHHRVGHI